MAGRKSKFLSHHGKKFFPGLCVLTVLLFADEAYSQKLFAEQIKSGGSPIATLQSRDNGYVSVSAIGSSTFLVRKTRSSGTRVWERVLGFTTSDPVEQVEIDGIAQTTDGGYVLVGSRIILWTSSGILVKLKAGGSIQWTKGFSASNGVLVLTSVSDTADGGFIVTGRSCTSGGFSCSQFNTILLTFNSLGTVVTAKRLENLILSLLW